MKTKSFQFIKIPFFLCLMAICIANSATGQRLQNDVVASTGGYATVGGISIEFTIGEIAIETLTTGSMILTQGFHQPFLTVTAIESIDMLKDIIVFPNPLAEMLSIDIPLSYDGMFTISIFDMNGRIMNAVTVFPGLNTIDMSSYAPASYLLVALHKKSGRQHQSKIVKIR